MNTKVIMAIMLVLSMFMVGSAVPTVTEHEDSFDYYSDTSYSDPNDYMYVEADAQYQYTETEYNYGPGYSYIEYEGTADAHAELGHVCVEGDTTTTDAIGANIHIEAEGYTCNTCYYDEFYVEGDFEGNWYTSNQVDKGRHHTYFEEGYMFEGNFWVYHCDGWWGSNTYGDIDFTLYEYYNLTRSWSDERTENQMNSPSAYTLGNPGDVIPVLYTWKEAANKFKHHTTTYFPAEGTYQGCVIVTPSQVVGEDFPNNGGNFEDTAKGIRVTEWKANHQ